MLTGCSCSCFFSDCFFITDLINLSAYGNRFFPLYIKTKMNTIFSWNCIFLLHKSLISLYCLKSFVYFNCTHFLCCWYLLPTKLVYQLKQTNFTSWRFEIDFRALLQKILKPFSRCYFRFASSISSNIYPHIPCHYEAITKTSNNNTKPLNLSWT